MADFKIWFTNAGGTLSPAVDICDFPGLGRGAIALEDIPENSELFSIPRSILLSTRTTILKERLGDEDWAALGSGWQPLIVAMMWEEAQGEKSLWHGYLQDMPEEFDSLMFWTQDELEWLQASTIKDKIGKADTESEFAEKVLPIIQRRADVFGPSLAKYFTIERFHINGSRILSRSFHVEEWEQEDASEDGDGPDHASPMSEDAPVAAANAPAEGPAQEGHAGNDSDDGDDEELDDVAMVPMADILNARYGSENAKLFYEKDVLKMMSTKPISKGEQIWNTYGDPPNGDLLRRYGHIDVIPTDVADTKNTLFPFENPADDVEISANLVLDICLPGISADEKQQKVDVWLSLGGEDTFALDREDTFSKPMLGMIQYLSMTDIEVQEAIEKDKLPKGKPTGETLSRALEVYKSRLQQYPTSVKEDEALLQTFEEPRNRFFNAVFVRLGEKRILECAIAKAGEILAQKGPSGRAPKRARQEKDSAQSRKKSKR